MSKYLSCKYDCVSKALHHIRSITQSFFFLKALVCFTFHLFFSLSAVNLEMRSGGVWVLANINVTGYYRVNYDLGNWERLFAQLNSDHQVHSLKSETALSCFRFYGLMAAGP